MTAAEDLLAAEELYLLPNQPRPHKSPPIIVGGEGCYLIDHSGRRYLDCWSGMGVMNAGHGNPAILNSVVDQLWRLQRVAAEHLAEPPLQLAEAVARLMPSGLGHSVFCTTAADANEIAIRLARLATGRRGIIALGDATLGWTQAPSFDTVARSRRGPGGTCAGMLFAPHPFCPRCPIGKTYPDCRLACAEEVGRVVERAGPSRIAAMVAEPIASGAGVVVPPDGYWQRVREVCASHGILLVFTEVRTGMERTGGLLSGEHWQVTPDILTLGEAFGSGLPIAAVVVRNEIAKECPPGGAGSHPASPVCCAAALATLRFLALAKLGQRARQQGAALLDGIEQVAREWEHLARPRGKGLMVGVDVVDAKGAPDARRCRRYLEQLKEWGFLAGRTGRNGNVLTLMPPLTVTEEQVSLIVAALDELRQAKRRAR